MNVFLNLALSSYSASGSYSPKSPTYIARLRLGLSHFRDCKIKLFSGHTNFGSDFEMSTHHLLHRLAYRNKRVNF